MSVPTLMDSLGHSPRDGWTPGSRETPADVRERLPLGGQAATIREMLSRLDTFTAAGQRHSMSKIVEFVGQHVRCALHSVGARNGSMLGELTAWLQAESERALPDVATFTHRAEDLLALLLAAA